MEILKGTKNAHSLAKRIGKKAIFYGRVAASLGVVGAEKDKRLSIFKRLRAFRPTKKQTVVALIALLVVGLVSGGLVMYQNKKVADENAAAVAEQQKVEKQNAAAQVCYKQKLKEKASMLGKITYDQLYDGNACLQ